MSCNDMLGMTIWQIDLTILIPLLPRYHPSHPAFRVLNIAFVAWNQVDMNMEYTLSSGLVHVDTNIETIGLETVLQNLFATVH